MRARASKKQTDFIAALKALGHPRRVFQQALKPG
jgi:hypothetical protein